MKPTQKQGSVYEQSYCHIASELFARVNINTLKQTNASKRMVPALVIINNAN